MSLGNKDSTIFGDEGEPEEWMFKENRTDFHKYFQIISLAESEKSSAEFWKIEWLIFLFITYIIIFTIFYLIGFKLCWRLFFVLIPLWFTLILVSYESEISKKSKNIIKMIKEEFIKT